MRTRSVLALTLVTCSILAGCDKCSKDKEPADAGAKTDAAQPADATAVQPITGTQAPVVGEPAQAAGAATELQITDVTAGTGVEATDGKKVTVHYTGTLTDGTKFDSSKDRGTPFPFVLGSGMVIAGWEQGVKGMKEGGVRKLVIPPNLAYGNRGVGSVIPPNSTLVFEIELLKVE